MSGSRSYNTIPDRTESPVIYAEGGNPEEVLDFLSNLSEESEMYVESYNMGLHTSPVRPRTGEKVAEQLEPEDGEGYVLALYQTHEGNSVDDAEVYAAISKGLPRNLGQRIWGENPSIVDGARITGGDETLDKEEMWQEARKAGIEDSRLHRRFDRGDKAFLRSKIVL